MSRRKLTLVLTMILFVSIGRANGQDDAKSKKEVKFDIKALQGSWAYTAGQRDGEKVDITKYKDSVDITKDTLTLNGEQKFVMKYEIDETKKPMTIKLTMTESPFGAGATAEGVLELSGDGLKLCYAPMGGDAPTDFDAKSGSGFHLFSLERKPEKLDAKKIIGDWVYVSGQRDGQKLDAEHFANESVVVTKEAFELKGAAEFVMKYKLDETKTPAAVDFTISEGPYAVGSKAPGIIQMKGEQLSVCYAAMGGDRPKNFESKSGSGNFLFVLKKKSDKKE